MPAREQTGSSRRRIGAVAMLRLWCSIALALTLLVAAVGVQLRPSAALAMQSGTPEVEDDAEPEGTPADEEADEEPEESTSRSAGPVSDVSLGPGLPAVLAQGLTYVEGGELVWTVTEVDVPDLEDAEATAGGSALFLQREGASIIRNDVTGKRARIEPGEAFFRAPDDAYTISADGSNASYWSFELVSQDDVNEDAFYEGPLIEGVDEATYDMEMTRFILQPGESADLPAYNGTGLTMVLSGEIEVRGERVAALAENDGQTMHPDSGEATVSNPGSDVAMYVFIALGDEVSDDTAGAGTANQPTVEATAAPQETPDTSVEDETPADSSTGTLNDNISITALAEIYVTVTVDGTVAYDGTLAAGQSTGPIVGTNFEVYTSSGANTEFTNGCGDVFYMSYEPGEQSYGLTADGSACG